MLDDVKDGEAVLYLAIGAAIVKVAPFAAAGYWLYRLGKKSR